MLHLHLGNHSETLLQALLDLVRDCPEDPFQPECIVVEEPGMARWLSWQLAQALGIAANIDFVQPAGFVWQLLRRQLQLDEQSVALNKGNLLWSLMALLPQLCSRPDFSEINHYLDAADAETRLYQLSRELADLFDQYLVYRHDLIHTWEQGRSGQDQYGKHATWQAELWRALRAQSQARHWPELLDAFRSSVLQHGLQPGAVPPRVSVFGVAALSPKYVELLQLLAQYCELHVFLLNPSREYWGDIESEQVLARLRDKWRRQGRDDVSQHFSAGSPLLAALGRPRRDFLDLWLEGEALEHEHYAANGSHSLLACLQDDLLELRARGSEGEPPCELAPDASLRVLDCYSPLREVEALHDELLSLFTQLPQLQPHEIVVLAPDISVYAPALDAVFNAAPPGRAIPCNIVAAALQQPLPELLLGWLRLPTERFAAPTVLGWLELAAVQRRLGIGPDELPLLREWVARSAIRWGLDAAHKQDLQLPAEAQNSWDFGLRRLFLGYALPEESGLYAGVDPCGGIEGSLAPLLGILQQFLEQLSAWRSELAQPATARQWQQRLNRMLEQFCLPEDEELLQVDALRQALAQLVQQTEQGGFEGGFSAVVLQQHLQQALQGAAGGMAVINGRMTCTDLVALRGVPFRVVCLLGLNDAAFPRSRRAPGFDLMAAQPRRGDRSLRDDDRLLFLEALLSARDALRLSFVGRSQQDNSEYQPSVVVSELLDYLCQGYRLSDADLRQHLWRQQPLQPFSSRAFEAGSHAAEWLQRVEPAAAFSATPLSAAQERSEWRLVELQQFLRNPARHFLEQALGLRLDDGEASLDADEPFVVAGLEAYGLRSAVLNLQLQQLEPQQILATLRAHGTLPAGALAAQACTALQEELQPLTQQLAPLLAAARRVELDPGLLQLPLQGRVPYVVEQGLLQFRPVKKLKSSDLLQAWAEHLALCAMGYTGRARLFALEEQQSFAALEAGAAREQLQQLLSLLQDNFCQLQPLLPQASRAWATALQAGKDAATALKAAQLAWSGSDYAPGDSQDAWLALAFRDRDPFTPAFCSLAEAVWLPLLQQLGDD
jgi:exodeoxyribonuclease V gamma subunit